MVTTDVFLYGFIAGYVLAALVMLLAAKLSIYVLIKALAASEVED